MVLRHEEVEVAIPAEVGKARAGVSILGRQGGGPGRKHFQDGPRV